MRTLNLDISSLALLTRTVVSLDPTIPNRSFLCDIDGNEIFPPNVATRIYRDTFSGLTFARVAEVLPSGSNSAAVEEKARILALKPIHYVSPDGNVKGYFVEAPDFNNREPEPPVVPVAPVDPTLPAAVLAPNTPAPKLGL